MEEQSREERLEAQDGIAQENPKEDMQEMQDETGRAPVETSEKSVDGEPEQSEEVDEAATDQSNETAETSVAATGQSGESAETEAIIEAIIEAILFAMGDTVEISKLAEASGCNVKTVKKILGKMEERYAASDRGIMLTQFDNAVQLCTKPEMYEYLIRIAKNPRKMVLTDTVIETLSIIAYKQPVTRLDVESIRGVNCDHAINKLLEYDLITELGRLDAPGRPILFGTTEQFLRCFGVKSLEELPELSTVQLEEFKAQAEAEIQLKLDI